MEEMKNLKKIDAIIFGTIICNGILLAITVALKCLVYGIGQYAEEATIDILFAILAMCLILIGAYRLWRLQKGEHITGSIIIAEAKLPRKQYGLYVVSAVVYAAELVVVFFILLMGRVTKDNLYAIVVCTLTVIFLLVASLCRIKWYRSHQ